LGFLSEANFNRADANTVEALMGTSDALVEFVEFMICRIDIVL